MAKKHLSQVLMYFLQLHNFSISVPAGKSGMFLCINLKHALLRYEHKNYMLQYFQNVARRAKYAYDLATW